MISAMYNRIAIDVAAVNIEHVRVDKEDHYEETIFSGLNDCLKYSANIDQSGREFVMDIVLTMMDEGVAAVVPVDLDVSPVENNSYDIKTMRVGKIREWFPDSVRVDLYNDRTGRREEITVPKSMTAIIQNPLYAVMNEPNSTLQRLIHKLALLDVIDEQSGSGKLDLIIQLPYVIKTEARRQQAEERRKQIEQQLKDSKYGIAYTDGTEHITQLNRSVENNLLDQVKYLETKLYGQMGVSENVLNGTANEEEMLNYYNRTLEPILSSITDNMTRTFLTKTARTQGQRVKFFRDPFRLIESSTLAELADKFTRNEIMSSNEFRAVIGLHKSDDPKADQLINSNLNQASDQNSNYTADPSDSGMYEEGDEPADDQISEDEYNEANSQLDELDKLLDELTKQVQGA
nr:MAG TPA: portal protein [Caudoviricetes sp.]